MVLNNATIEKIKSLVYSRPRNINEIAMAIGKNWRTADRYVDDIMLKTGVLKSITFRKGTRGALKVVYWNNTEKIYATDIQEKLFRRIELALDKSDFSPFEIYQYVDSDKRNAYYEEIDTEEEYSYNIETLIPYLESAEKEVSLFAGNLALLHLKHKKKKIIDYIKDCIKRKIIVKVITNINLSDLENVELLLSLNSGLKEPLVEIRHEITPIRAYLFDDKIAKLGEIQRPLKKTGQKQDILAIYYEIRDEAWVDWLQKLFWKKFQNAIPSALRIENLNNIKKISS